jgi:hypothetical protein
MLRDTNGKGVTVSRLTILPCTAIQAIQESKGGVGDGYIGQHPQPFQPLTRSTTVRPEKLGASTYRIFFRIC